MQFAEGAEDIQLQIKVQKILWQEEFNILPSIEKDSIHK